MESLIIILIIIIIVLIAVGIVVVNVMRAVRTLRRAASSEAAQLIGKLAGEILSGEGDASIEFSTQEPKSISDMTSLYSSLLAKDFPDLNLGQLISAAENKLYSGLTAIMEGSAAGTGTQIGSMESSYSEDSASPDGGGVGHLFLGATPDFAAQIQRQTDSLVQKGQTEYFERIRIHRTGINNYQKNAGTCVITLQTSIEYLHYIKQNGVVVSGNTQIPEQNRYNIVLLYVQDVSHLLSSETNAVGVTCPNCGAAVSGLGHRMCEYCGTAIKTIDIRIWRINQFSEC